MIARKRPLMRFCERLDCNAALAQVEDVSTPTRAGRVHGRAALRARRHQAFERPAVPTRDENFDLRTGLGSDSEKGFAPNLDGCHCDLQS